MWPRKFHSHHPALDDSLVKAFIWSKANAIPTGLRSAKRRECCCWVTYLGIGVYVRVSHWIVPKRHPRKACDPSGPPTALVLVVIVDQDREGIRR